MSDSTVTMISVSSVVPNDVQKGFTLITANTRETEKTGKIEEANKRRCVVIPEFQPEGVPSKFQTLVVNALERAATEQLKALWDEKGNSISEVPASAFTLDGVLLYIAREAESQRLTKDSISKWLAVSELNKRLDAATNKDAAKALKDGILSLAAPTLKTSMDDCKKLIASIQKDEKDSSSQFGQRLLKRLTDRVAELEKQMKEVSAIEEI